MNELSDADWELVNAYHDGELGEADMLSLKSRIECEPALARALADIRSASASLAAVRPDIQHVLSDAVPAPANSTRKPIKSIAFGAVAAVIALAVALGSTLFAPPTALEIHTELSAQKYMLDRTDLRLVTANIEDGVPDLTNANLTPVVLRRIDGGQVAHYVGRNGCRLSYFSGDFRLPDTKQFPGQQVEMWTTSDSMLHMTMASGMDQSRFDAIVTYLKLATRQVSTGAVSAAVSDATKAATPCVG